MSASEHAEQGRIFTQACHLAQPARAAFLDDACAGEPGLRAEVDALLAADAGADESLDAAAGGAELLAGALVREGEIAPLAQRHPERIGKYRIVRLIAEGGMGLVYEAEQDSPRRAVALKVVRPSLVTSELLSRFQREARLLGLLRHPGIAQIYEASTNDTDEGLQPYFAMELVEGERFDEYAEAHDLDIHARLELIARLCDSLHYAHQKGVVHRDLKPANILVTSEALTPPSQQRGSLAALHQPKILDFGVALATDSDRAEVTLKTTEGQLVGTVPYMSPEQASGDSAPVDARSDVYAVGLIAYELLAGCLPYEVRGKPMHEAVRIIREDEPSRLGTVDRTLRGDVETIVAKALEKDKQRRYGSAADLAADIRRFIQDVPIVARPPTASYKLRKFAKRNKGLVGGAVATLVAAITGAVVAIGYAIDATQRADALEKVVDFQSGQLKGIDAYEMGLHLRRTFLAETRAVMQRAGIGDEELEERTSELEALCERTNFTDIALQSLDVNIFSPVLRDLENQLVDQPVVRAELFHTLARTLNQVGIFALVGEPQERALEIRREVLGDKHEDTLLSILELASLRSRQGRFADAEALFREVLAVRRRTLPDDHLLGTIEGLACVLRDDGREAETVPLWSELHDSYCRILGEGHAKTLHVLADLRLAEGRPAEAARLFREVLASWRERDGDQPPSLGTLITLRNLAETLDLLGQLEEAESLLRESLAGSGPLWGESHFTSWRDWTLLGNVLRKRGKWTEAEDVLRTVLAKREQALREDHPETLATRRALDALLEAKR